MSSETNLESSTIGHGRHGRERDFCADDSSVAGDDTADVAGKTNMDFTEARDSEWQWHPLGHMQVCISLQTDDYASIPPLSFLQAGCPSCRPTNSVKALKAITLN